MKGNHISGGVVSCRLDGKMLLLWYEMKGTYA